MGRVLPRENCWVEVVPCRILTQSTGSRCGVGGLLSSCDRWALATLSSRNTVPTVARPDVLRKVRLLGPFALSFDILTRDAFPEVNL
jgi:hypothetical protein